MFRYNPDLVAQGKNPFQLDSKAPSIPLEKYIYNETRYTMLTHSQPEAAKQLLVEAQEDVNKRWRLYEHMSHMSAVEVQHAAAAAGSTDTPKPTAEAAAAKGAGK
jgi:pyruvate-ferredoxin/flavodoxin oxidoreductase